ncbi:LysM domain-containing protein [Colletotrichum sojae]|uniref:LysM domain-containing protein n=1 Tax=Colletotrichum sojae TaxID=2175907 RepID=A0A8H6IMS6_9PEZI|nr:LysM domain-containing protein [Colletotrichum sojae]
MQSFLIDLLVAASTASASILLYSDSLPSTLTSECTAALSIDVTACDPLVRDLRPEVLYPNASLTRKTEGAPTLYRGPLRGTLQQLELRVLASATTPYAIYPAGEEWRLSVKTQCGTQTVPADLGVEAAAVHIPGALQFSFHNAFYNTTGQERPDECDACLVERLRLREGSPYFDGPIAASESLALGRPDGWGVWGGLGLHVEGFSGLLLRLKGQSVGTDWLLADNNLAAFCADFPTTAGAVLCINNQCTTATVPVNATCGAMATASNITEAQLKAWNPSISHGCANLRRMNGSEVCVGAPGRKFVAPDDTAALPPQTPITAAPKPTDATEGSGGSGRPCGRWYSVQKGDYCNLLAARFGIALADFLFLNAALNANCTNLFASESYRVAEIGDINTYSDRPGHGGAVTLDPSAPFDGVRYTERPDATGTPHSRLYTAPPLASGTRADSTSPTRPSPATELAAETYNVDLETFGLWNAGLGNVSDSKCAFKKGVRYCGSWYVQCGGPGAPAATTTIGGGEDVGNASSTNTSPTNTSSTNTSSTSTTLANASPTNMTPTNSSPTNSSSINTSPTDTSPTPPGPTMSGSPTDCNKWSLVTDGLSCTSMASEAGISLGKFLAWNPAVSPDCLKNYWLDYAYGVGVSGGSIPPKTTSGPLGPTAKGEPDN